ncbi:uncharacterized protein [Amphiura filiformis]|uniref:uncharacterized protein n=1 Tax=Amphiura filiformis TaxID=82378 RepID=UPI003B227BBD
MESSSGSTCSQSIKEALSVVSEDQSLFDNTYHQEPPKTTSAVSPSAAVHSTGCIKACYRPVYHRHIVASTRRLEHRSSRGTNSSKETAQTRRNNIRRRHNLNNTNNTIGTSVRIILPE